MPYHDWFGLMLEGPELPTTAASVVLGGDSAMDVLNLSVYDLDGERGMLMVRQGKGKKDRMVPIGEQAIAWMDRYLKDVRPHLLTPPDDWTFPWV